MSSARIAVAVAVVAAIALAGCGGSGKASTSATKATDAPSTETSAAPSETKTTPADSGSNDDNSGSAGRADLPRNFPTDRIPVPEGVTVKDSTAVDGGDTMTFFVTFTTDKSVNAISDYYVDALHDRGWHKIIEQDTNGSHLASYSSNEDGSGDIVNVTATPNADSSGKTDVGLQVGLTK